MRGIIILVVWLCLPLAALAESVAVLPVIYKIYKTNADSEERAAKVKEAVVRGVEKAGLTPMVGDDIDLESQALAPLKEKYCISSECPLQVANKVGADLGVVVWVSDHDGQFDIQIYTTYADPISKNPFGTLKSMQKRITALVADSLKEALRNMPAPAAAEEETAKTDDEVTPPPPADMTGQAQDSELLTGETGTGVEVVAEDVTPPKPDLSSGRKKFKKPVFWSLFGVSLALGIGYATSEGLGYAAKMSNKDPDQDEKNALKAWQLANRVALGVTAAMVITTGVIAFFTDFSASKDDTTQKEEEIFNRLGGESSGARPRHRVDAFLSRLKFLPTVDVTGGGFALQGAF